MRARLKHNFLNYARWSYRRLLTQAGMVIRVGKRPWDPQLPTIIIAGHEASATGAPILALNLCQRLCEDHNVIVILLKGGALLSHFQENCCAVITSRRAFVNRELVRRAIDHASGGTAVAFALVNSIVSAPLVEPLRALGIPCLVLVHEFAADTKPLSRFSEASLWASRVVCSTPITWHDVLRNCPQLGDVPMAVLPQGRCQPPHNSRSLPAQNLAAAGPSSRDAERFLMDLPADCLLVLGAGTVCTRKGVDLFVAAAQQIRPLVPDLPVRFAWIGSGFAPDRDLAVSVWVQDQIERSGLADQLTMLDESPAYSALVKRSDLFLVTSRLDPLPNVAIDAMFAATPVLCFAEACGLACLLEQQPDLHDACVAPFFDCTGIAQRAAALLRSPERRRLVAQRSLELARTAFHMPSYIRRLLELVRISSTELQQEDADIAVLHQQRLVDRDFHSPGGNLSDLALSQRYLLSWRCNLQPRKPFAGFHPGIYRECALPQGSRRDPLAHWQERQRPPGPWQVPVIRPGPRPTGLPDASQVALHIHVFYPELLAPMLELLAHNQVLPDLFLTFSNPDLEPAIRLALRRGPWPASLHPVPNRGRDIGPLLTELGQHLDNNYCFYGHLHTKRSVLINEDTAGQWRQFLLRNLLGSAKAAMLDQILAVMQADPQIGLVFPDDPGCLGWTANRKEAEILADRLGLPPLPEAIHFPVGTMFWARRGALTRLYGLGLGWQDYPKEPLGYDGTMLHAIERLLPQICLASGHTYAVTHVPGCSR
jgi:glycosyltransferase involved in cell wall biosynthesis